jgi:hypothetical protein
MNYVLTRCLFRNTPQDTSPSPISFDEMFEIFNQISIYIAKKKFKHNFWDSEGFLRLHKTGFVKWQKAWSNRIKHFTPHEKPDYDLAPDGGIIEKWDTKIPKETSQIKTIKFSPMFGADVVRQYKAAKEVHPPGTAVKSEESAEKLRAVFGLDIRFMVGCDQPWEFSDDDETPSSAAGPAPQPAVLTPAAPNDDAPAGAPVDAPVDSSDFTEWNVLDLKSIPLPEQNYDAGDFKARRSAHAALLLCYMSPEMEAAFPDQAQRGAPHPPPPSPPRRLRHRQRPVQQEKGPRPSKTSTRRMRRRNLS